MQASIASQLPALSACGSGLRRLLCLLRRCTGSAEHSAFVLVAGRTALEHLTTQAFPPDAASGMLLALRQLLSASVSITRFGGICEQEMDLHCRSIDGLFCDRRFRPGGFFRDCGQPESGKTNDHPDQA